MEKPDIQPQNIQEANRALQQQLSEKLKEKLAKKRGEAPEMSASDIAKKTESSSPSAQTPPKVENTSVQRDSSEFVDHRKKFQEDKFRNMIISDIAQDIHDRRWDANKARWLRDYDLKLDPDQINQLLIDNRIDPKTPKAAEFMEKWDWEQAAKIYESIYGTGPKKKETSAPAEVAKAAEAKKEPVHEYDLPKEERDPVKAVALHTIYKAKHFEDLNASDLAEGDRKIIELTKELWDEFATHGFSETDPVSGEIRVKTQSDLDGRSFLAILKKAGIKVDKVTYVAQGALPESKSGVVGDTSNEDGVVAKDGGRLFISDHHGEGSGRDTSATKNMYEALRKFGLFNEKYFDLQALENFVDFVTKEDNKDYSNEEIELIIDNLDKNLIGLQRYMDEEQLMKVFEDYSEAGLKFNPYDALPEDYLETLNFRMPNGTPIKSEKERPIDIVAKKLSNLRNMALSSVKKLAEEGYVVDTGDGRFGKILIDTGIVTGQSRKKKLKGEIAIEAARYSGFGGIVYWNPEKNNFSIQTANDFDFDLPDGFNSRGHYWLKIPGEEKMNTTLEEILEKLAGKKDFQMDESLQKSIDKSKIRSADKRRGLNEEQKEILADMTKKARLDEIEKKMPKDDSGMLAENKRLFKIRSIALAEAKRSLRNMAMNFSESDSEFFRDEFMEQILGYYQTERKKVSITEFPNFKREFLENVSDIARESGFSEDGAEYIKNYFRSRTNLESLLNESK